MASKGRCVVYVFVAFAIAVVLGVGILIGYLAIPDKDEDRGGQDKETATQAPDSGAPSANVQSYQAKCTAELELAKTCSPSLPRYYVAYKKTGNITVDGKLDDPGWINVTETENFVDIRGTEFPTPSKETRVKVVWDDTHVYVGARLTEDQVWATFTQKDSEIYKENAFEIFFDVDNSMSWYKEFEINALGTTWDLMLSRAYIDGGNYMNWEGIVKSGVYADHGVNNISDPSTFWSMEVSFPIAKLIENTSRADVPPSDGEVWFTIFARPQYQTRPNQTTGEYEKVPGTDASWYSWNPVGAVSLHLPNKWGLMFFSEQTANNTQMTYPEWPTYQALFHVFETMQTFKALNGMFVDDLRQLELLPFVMECFSALNISLTADGFEASLVSSANRTKRGYINQNRKVWFTAENVDSQPQQPGSSFARSQSYREECSAETELARTCMPDLPRYYVAYKKSGNITIDGDMSNDPGWEDVPWTEDFVDIRGFDFPRPRKETRVKVVWDDTHIYVGAKLMEDQVWATYKEKDSRIYQENAFEIFFDVDNSMSWYKEFEINALGTTWDLQLSRAYIDGGNYTDWEGIEESAVHTDEGVNDINNPSSYWSMEVSFPIANLTENTTRENKPPSDGEAWFTIFARPQYETQENRTTGQYEKKPGTDASWYSWNPTGAVALHLPNKWGLLFFSSETPSQANFQDRHVTYPDWPTYQALFHIFEVMHEFKTLNGMFVDDMRLLELSPFVKDCFSGLTIRLTDDGFEASLVSKSVPGKRGHINQNREVRFT